MQAIIAVSFVFLNFSYWCTASRHRKHSWKIHDIFKVAEHPDEDCVKKSYTLCLFAVICASGESKWLKDTNAVPDTPGWKDWLDEAYKHREDSKSGSPEWDATAEMERLVLGRVPGTP